MANKVIPAPEIVIKDTQAMDNIHWEDCILLLKIGTEEMQWGVYKRETNYFIRLYHYVFDKKEEPVDFQERIKQVIAENAIQVERCYKIKVVIDTPLFTVVPESYYEDTLQEVFFRAIYGKVTDVKLLSDAVSSKKMELVYGVDETLFHYLNKLGKKVTIFHNLTLLLGNIKEEAEVQKALYVVLHPQYISILAFSEGKPLLIQSYTVKKPLDVVYHILNVLEQHKIEEDTILYLTGYDKDAAFLQEKLERKFSAVQWVKRPKGCLYPQEMNKYAVHYFYHLVSLALCELSVEN